MTSCNQLHRHAYHQTTRRRFKGRSNLSLGCFASKAGNNLLYAAKTCIYFGFAIIKLCINGLRPHYGVLYDTTEGVTPYHYNADAYSCHTPYRTCVHYSLLFVLLKTDFQLNYCQYSVCTSQRTQPETIIKTNPLMLLRK